MYVSIEKRITKLWTNLVIPYYSVSLQCYLFNPFAMGNALLCSGTIEPATDINIHVVQRKHLCLDKFFL